MWSVDSETGRLTDALVCAPDHYRWIAANAVARRTLAAGGQADLRGVQAQHRELVAALEGGGVRVHRVPPEPHLPYMADTRDSVVVTHRGPVLWQLERPQRRGEYAHLLAWHEANGGRFWRMSSAGTLEGGDVHIVRPGLAVVGASGGRTDLAGAEQFAGWLRAEGWEVRVEPFDEHFLHLDVLFCMAAPGLPWLASTCCRKASSVGCAGAASAACPCRTARLCGSAATSFRSAMAASFPPPRAGI